MMKKEMKEWMEKFKAIMDDDEKREKLKKYLAERTKQLKEEETKQ